MNREMRREYWAVAVIAASVLLVVGIFAARGVDRAKERTFFGDKRDRMWAVTPVVVSASAAVNEQFKTQVAEAVRDINNETKCSLVTISGAPVQIRVLDVSDDVPCMGKGEPLPSTAGAATYVCEHGTTDILLSGLEVEPRKAYVLLKHELGHALGLDDDPGSDDVMGPHLTEQSWQDIVRPLPWLSSKDRKGLRGRYPEACR